MTEYLTPVSMILSLWRGFFEHITHTYETAHGWPCLPLLFFLCCSVKTLLHVKTSKWQKNKQKKGREHCSIVFLSAESPKFNSLKVVQVLQKNMSKSFNWGSVCHCVWNCHILQDFIFMIKCAQVCPFYLDTLAKTRSRMKTKESEMDASYKNSGTHGLSLSSSPTLLLLPLSNSLSLSWLECVAASGDLLCTNLIYNILTSDFFWNESVLLWFTLWSCFVFWQAVPVQMNTNGNLTSVAIWVNTRQV